MTPTWMNQYDWSASQKSRGALAGTWLQAREIRCSSFLRPGSSSFSAISLASQE